MKKAYIQFLITVVILLSYPVAPTHAANDGLFGDYFRNMIGNSCDGVSPEYKVVTGFDSTLGSPSYGKTQCISVRSILGNVFSGSIQPGQVFAGFDVNGDPKYDYGFWKPKNTPVNSIEYIGDILVNSLRINSIGLNAIFGSPYQTVLGTLNTLIGYGAGGSLVTGSNNIAIGANTTLPNTLGSNQLVIGNWITGKEDRSMTINATSITINGGKTIATTPPECIGADKALQWSNTAGWICATLNVAPPNPCTLPWGGTLQSGSGVTAYAAASVAYGNTCSSQTRTCTNGTLSGSYTHASCVVGTPVACTLPWGGSLAHGQSVTAYSTSVSSNCSGVSETRTCTNGVLGGSYGYQGCSSTVSISGYQWDLGFVFGPCYGGPEPKASCNSSNIGQFVSDPQCGSQGWTCRTTTHSYSTPGLVSQPTPGAGTYGQETLITGYRAWKCNYYYGDGSWVCEKDTPIEGRAKVTGAWYYVNGVQTNLPSTTANLTAPTGSCTKDSYRYEVDQNGWAAYICKQGGGGYGCTDVRNLNVYRTPCIK